MFRPLVSALLEAVAKVATSAQVRRARAGRLRLCREHVAVETRVAHGML
jgi:hypothetical protein